MEQDLKSKKELEQLKIEKGKLEASGLGQKASNAGLVVSCSVSGLSKGASAETVVPKKKKGKQKRHPGLPSEERQEYYMLYLACLLVLALFWCY